MPRRIVRPQDQRQDPRRPGASPQRLQASPGIGSVQRPQNIGANRNTQMRNNSRNQQNRGTFQGGLALSRGLASQQANNVNTGQCPAGQQPKMVNGRMQCIAAGNQGAGNQPRGNQPRGNQPATPKPGSGNRGY